MLFGVAVNFFLRERRRADRDVVRSTRLWTTVSHPLAWPSHDCLAGTDVNHSTLMLDSNHAIEYERDFLKRRPLPGFAPAFRRTHTRNADVWVVRINASSKFLNLFRYVPHRLYDAGLLQKPRHRLVRFGQANLKDPRPQLACDEEVSSRRVVGNTVQHALGIRRTCAGHEVRQIESSDDDPGFGINGHQLVPVPDVGPDVSVDILELV